ncbi:unnamed protein product [Schistosoma margrebowiei]|uniref:Uncharacterized protein n=1 Tax=Schistosoma margrebowiei TaxID=48269 RepID=A0A183N6K7_9TREM|nr:unnamed protein product [Schistosoma margrebowiei]
MTKEDDEDVIIVAYFLTFIGKEAYSLLRTLAMPEKPISLPYATLNELLIDYVKYANFDCSKVGKFPKLIHQDIKHSTTSRHPNPSSISNDDLSLSTIAIDSVESPSSSELNQIQNSCETTVSNQSIYQNSRAIVPESNPDVIRITYPHNAFAPCEKPVQCKARILNELGFDYNSDDFIPTAVHPYHKSTYNVYSSQCEKYFLNEDTLFITWEYKDPTLFRGGG